MIGQVVGTSYLAAACVGRNLADVFTLLSFLLSVRYCWQYYSHCVRVTWVKVAGVSLILIMTSYYDDLLGKQLVLLKIEQHQ